MSEAQEKMMQVACAMYGTAAQLNMSGLVADAATVATKAKALMNKALDGLIEVNTSHTK